MSTMVITERRSAEASPQFLARMAGVTALITTTAAFTAAVVGRLVVYSDAAATAHNLLANETLFRLAVAGSVIQLLYIPFTVLVYYLFRPVSRSLSLLAAVFSLVGSAAGVVNTLLLLAPLVVLENGQSLSGFSAPQLQSQALLFLHLYVQGSNIDQVLFGAYDLLIGFLILRSNFLPRFLGVLQVIAGVCYLFNCFAIILSPAFAAHLLPYILIPGGVDLLLPLWFVVFGVNERRWKEQASAAGGRQ